MTDTPPCEPTEHDLGEPGDWWHPAGTNSVYRTRACRRCGESSIEAVPIFQDPPMVDVPDLEQIIVSNGDPGRGAESVASALAALNAGAGSRRRRKN